MLAAQDDGESIFKKTLYIRLFSIAIVTYLPDITPTFRLKQSSLSWTQTVALISEMGPVHCCAAALWCPWRWWHSSVCISSCVQTFQFGFILFISGRCY